MYNQIQFTAEIGRWLEVFQSRNMVQESYTGSQYS